MPGGPHPSPHTTVTVTTHHKVNGIAPALGLSEVLLPAAFVVNGAETAKKIG
jgi:hypothetical protein